MAPDSTRTTTRWMAVTASAPAVDPLGVARARGGLSAYWEQPSEGIAVAAFGAAAVREADNRAGALDLLSRLGDPAQFEWLGSEPVQGMPGPWFGGLAFDLSRPPSNEWRGFPAARWLLPELLVWTRGGRTLLTAFAPIGPDARATERQLTEQLQVERDRRPRNSGPSHPPVQLLRTHADKAAWARLVETSLAAIQAGTLSKVVAARIIEATAASPFEPLEILARLRSYAPGCTTFLLRGEGTAFVGATPETLCRIDGATLETEALAGSAAPGEPIERLESDKERREHNAVTDAIRDGLGPLCEQIDVERTPNRLVLPNVVHLRTPIRARLRSGVGAADVVRTIHPTPAVGGTPRERSLAFLREHEGFDRGWYAGAVGWVGPGAAELRVALRSALLDGARARLFVGAGLVAGSTVEDEWTETEAKSVPLLRVLTGGRETA